MVRTAVHSLLQQRFITLWISRSQLGCVTPNGVSAIRPSTTLGYPPRLGHPPLLRYPSLQAQQPFSSTSKSCIKSNDKSLLETITPSTESSTSLSSSTTTIPKQTRKKSKLEWTEETDNQLLELRVTQQMKWGDIGRHLGREPATCMNRFESTLNPALKDFWTSERDLQLDSLVTASKPWADIAQAMGVHRLACMERWRQRGLEELAKTSVSTIATRKKQTRERQRQRDLEGERSTEQLQQIRQLAMDPKASDTVVPIDASYDRQGWNMLLKDEQRYQHYRSWQRKSRIDTFSQLYMMNPGWSAKEETILIQHVLEHGLDQWELVAKEKLKGKFTREECRTCWKNLDMPVVGMTLPALSNKEPSPRPQAPSPIPSKSKSVGYRKDVFDDEEGEDDMYEEEEDDDDDEAFGGGRKWSQESRTGEIEGTEKQPTKKPKAAPFVWDKELSVRLQAVIRQAYKSHAIHIDEMNWNWISRRVHPDASSRICKNHWKFLHHPDQAKWSQEDIRRLEEGIRLLGPKKMTTLRAHFLPFMTKDDITRQWFRISDKPTLIDEEEYYRLQKAVEEHRDGEGVVQWQQVEKTMGSGWKKLPCKRVWESSYMNLIRSGMDKDSGDSAMIIPWTPGSDDLLLKMVKVVGRDDWYSVANAMQAGRSPWQCRLRWCKLLDPVEIESEDLFFKGQHYC